VARGLVGLLLVMALVACARAESLPTPFADCGPSGLGDLSRAAGLVSSDAGTGDPPAGLALAAITRGGKPELLLAQRTIERDWGPSTDSLDLAKRRAGWKSEPFSFASSALLPGAGQAYVGETSAIWFALAEAAGWTAHWLFHRDADRDREAAARIAGNPADSTSGWSFQRWEAADPARDASQIEALWLADRAAFYTLIASDPQYLDGWSGDPAATRASFDEQRDLADRALDRRRWSDIGLGLNHVIAAVDALRAARAHNLPVRRNLDLALRGHWGRRGPSVMAVLERRF
jgi:hypothetical protein